MLLIFADLRDDNDEKGLLFSLTHSLTYSVFRRKQLEKVTKTRILRKWNTITAAAAATTSSSSSSNKNSFQKILQITKSIQPLQIRFHLILYAWQRRKMRNFLSLRKNGEAKISLKFSYLMRHDCSFYS